MSGGIGESMLIGAAVGGGTALVTGSDPLQGALLGGITGGIGGAAFGGAGAAAGGVGGAAGGAGGAALGQGAAGLTGAGAGIASAAPATALNAISTPLIDASAGIASGAGGAGSTLGGITGLNPIATTPGIMESAVNPIMAAPMQQATQIPSLQGLGGMQPGVNINALNPDGLTMQSTTGLGGMSQGTPTPSTWVEQTYTGQPAAGQSSLADVAQVQQRNLANSAQYMDGSQVAQDAAKQPNMMDRFGNWYGGLSTPEKIGFGVASGVGLQALSGGLGPQMPAVEEEEENPYGFATYDRNKFTPYTPQPNVYKPGYAGGGIAAAAPNSMYPQGMQSNAQYAVSSQMPTSSEVINADYDAPTDPYTGQMMRMAEGGSTSREAIDRYLRGSMGSGDSVPTPTRSTPASTPVTDPKIIEQRRQDAERMAQWAPFRDGIASGMGGKGYGNGTGGGIFNQGYSPYDPRRGMYGKGGNSSFYARPVAPPSDYISKSFNPTPSPTANTNIYRPQFAAGGIAGQSHLGGYAAGGNPRLLKGPGDGMSDDIPAVIANKQPARLADGEFVIPADVVSHLGNGSTDAGAKHLHKMMDRVRKARTGNKAQGKQIKSAKFMPA